MVPRWRLTLKSIRLSRTKMSGLTTDAAPIAEGEVVAGKYRVGRVLGQGGMGVVVEATHVQLAQRVALKFLRAEGVGNPELVARFTREAQAAARIQGVHVARVLDVGELPSGAPYMVMEYLEGEDLERVLQRCGPLPIAEAVDLLLQGCEAVAEAHTLGIVHRDLKPANLFLARYPGGRQVVKVLDFGISKLKGPAGSPGLTQAASTFGSPPYMAPEQIRSTRAADVRSDVWSLGAVLYELLTQTTPFSRESVEALFAAILLEDPAPPRTIRAEIPPVLEQAVLRCLQKDPSKRFQDVASLAAALGRFGSPSSAEVPARIAHIASMGDGAGALSATAPAVGVAAGPSLAAREKLMGVPTAAPMESSQGIGAPRIAGREPPVPVAEPAPAQAATAGAAPTRVSAGQPRGARRVAVVVALAVVAAIATAYELGARTSPHETVAPGPPPSPLAAAPPSLRSAPSPSPLPSFSVALPAVPSEAPPERRPRPGAEPRPRERATSAVPPVPAVPAVPPTSVCADLLARQSLGETLTPDEAATYAHACKRQ